GAHTAQARMYCISIRLNQATDASGDTFSVNSSGTADGAGEIIPWGAPPQRELQPFPPIVYTSVASLYDSTYDYTFVDGSTFTIYLPELVDSDNNGSPDFFEVSQGIDTNAYNGSYTFGLPVGKGAIWTTWYRAPGSSSGTCTDYLPDYMSSFTHPFDLLEYTGSVDYTPGSNSVTAALTLKQTGSPANTFTGSMVFQKTPSDPKNTLALQYGRLADASQQTHWFTNHLFYRDVAWPTNYAGYVEFDDDGNQNTFYPYAFWVLTITDTNDVNGNGIPDFSDDPQPGQSTQPRPPQLALTLTSTNLLLRISGDVGHVHTVQTAPTLPGTWQDVTSLTLTNDPQLVPLTRSASSAYWRVFASP
ncbi:MAG: hypothetical protein ACREIC_32460, partial [Limisphaerales bacterium]